MKTLKLIAVTIIIGISGLTEAIAQAGLYVGVQGTPQWSWLVNKDDIDNDQFKYLATFNSSYGIVAQYRMTDFAGVGLSVNYSFQGQRYELEGIEYHKKTEYLKIPLTYIYYQELMSNVMFIGQIGPQLGILTNAKLTDKDNNDIKSDQKEAYQSADFGGIITLGLGVKLTESLLFDAAVRYDVGFTNAEDPDRNAHINTPSEPTNGNGTAADRATTTNMTAGVNIGLRYLIR